MYLLIFLLSLYGFGIPLFQNSRMVGPGGFVSGFFVSAHDDNIMDSRFRGNDNNQLSFINSQFSGVDFFNKCRQFGKLIYFPDSFRGFLSGVGVGFF